MRKINNFGHFGSHKMDIFLRSPVFKIKGFRQNFPIPYTVERSDSLRFFLGIKQRKYYYLVLYQTTISNPILKTTYSVTHHPTFLLKKR